MVQIRHAVRVQCTNVRRRLRRTSARAHHQAKAPAAARPDPLGLTAESFGPPAVVSEEPAPAVVREARRVERLAYTRTQAAQALGIGRSTFTQRVLPYVETVETPWGTTLIPADELERVLVEWRQPARPRRQPTTNWPAAGGDARRHPTDP